MKHMFFLRLFCCIRGSIPLFCVWTYLIQPPDKLTFNDAITWLSSSLYFLLCSKVIVRNDNKLILLYIYTPHSTSPKRVLETSYTTSWVSTVCSKNGYCLVGGNNKINFWSPFSLTTHSLTWRESFFHAENVKTVDVSVSYNYFAAPKRPFMLCAPAAVSIQAVHLWNTLSNKIARIHL